MKNKIIKYIFNWEQKCYINGIPDTVPDRIQALNKAPSYKSICIAIMKNDSCLEYLGQSKIKSDIYNSIKRAELIERGVIKSIQLKLLL